MGCGHKRREQPNRRAIVLAHFGTTVPSALHSLNNTKRIVEERFPKIPVAVSFTSNMIRNIWMKRRVEASYWLEQGVPREILYAKSILGVIGELQDQGYRSIVVQPTHIAHGEQYEDLLSYVRSLQSIRTIKERWMPFEKIVCSRPVLGTHGIDFDYHQDIEEVVSALEVDFQRCRRENASLVYVGHGNDYYSSGIYLEAQKSFRHRYPDVPCFIGVVEGFPSLGDLLSEMQRTAGKRILLKPFMLSAGDHAHNDICSNEKESWKTQLTEAGFVVLPVLEGLGSNDQFANLYVNRIQQTASKYQIDLFQQEESY